MWWLRSPYSGRLNLISYYLLAVIFAIPIYFAADIGFRVWSAVDENAWITGRRPSAFTAAAGADSPFIDFRDDLLSKVQDQNSVQGKAPLFAAHDLKTGKSGCSQVAQSFHNPDIRVYTDCVTFAPAAQKQSAPPANATADLDPSDQLVFEHFASFITRSFATTSPESDASFTERRLARTLKLKSGGIGPDLLDVPWIYIATAGGAIAVFPGTDVIADHWDAQSRPWHAAIFPSPGIPALSSDVSERGDRLSVTYLDVLAKSSILVRTYLYPFPVGNPKFVLGVDLKRRREALGGGKESHAVDSLWYTYGWPFRILASLAFAAAGLTVLRWLSGAKSGYFRFVRLPEPKPIYGLIEVKDRVQAYQEFEDQKTTMVGIGGGDYIWAKHAAESTRKDGGKGETVAERSRPLIRGLEYWNVGQATKTSWRLCGLHFESMSVRHVGRIEVSYTRAVLPDARFDPPFPSNLFAREGGDDYKDMLLDLIRKNADLADNDQVELPERVAASSAKVPKPPEWIENIVKRQEQVSLQHGRAYITLGSGSLQEIYVKADAVRAVILQNYFERLLDHGETDFLMQGRIVQRLVAFPSADADLRLTDKSHRNYEEFLAGYTSPSRILKRVDYPGSFKGMAPVYDFAIINDSLVFVAHRVYETSVIDIATPRRTTQTWVEGYLSWRHADVQFYLALFHWLAEQATEIQSSQDRTTISEGIA